MELEGKLSAKFGEWLAREERVSRIVTKARRHKI